MGILNGLMTYGKARLMRRVLGRTLGGSLGTALMVAWVGKKAFHMYQSRRATKPVVYGR